MIGVYTFAKVYFLQKSNLLQSSNITISVFHCAWSGQHGTMFVTMPSGERYSGKFVVGQTSSTGLGLGIKSGDPVLLDSSGNTSQTAAVLMGNKGDSMHCKFLLSHPSDGIEGGGVGHCKLSTGQVIDATF
ncbi:MAG: hypothetical protein ACRES9_05070 [Gammaproteobacteria bacterium]